MSEPFMIGLLCWRIPGHSPQRSDPLEGVEMKTAETGKPVYQNEASASYLLIIIWRI